MLQNIVALVGATAWPLTVFAVAWLFRHEVRAVVGRLQLAKLPGGTELSFGRTEADNPKPSMTTPDAEVRKQGSWKKTGNVYWLGHDIMWTIDVVLRGAPPRAIMHGLKQSAYHLREIGLAKSTYGTRLGRLSEKAADWSECDWNVTNRKEFALELRELSDELGAIAQDPAEDVRKA